MHNRISCMPPTKCRSYNAMFFFIEKLGILVEPTHKDVSCLRKDPFSSGPNFPCKKIRGIYESSSPLYVSFGKLSAHTAVQQNICVCIDVALADSGVYLGQQAASVARLIPLLKLHASLVTFQELSLVNRRDAF